MKNASKDILGGIVERTLVSVARWGQGSEIPEIDPIERLIK